MKWKTPIQVFLIALIPWSNLSRSHENIAKIGASDGSTPPISISFDAPFEVKKGAIIYKGAAEIISPLGKIPLGPVSIKLSDNKSSVYTSISGDVKMPFPDLGIFNSLVGTQPVSASIGIRTGKQLDNLSLPLVADRTYLYFEAKAGFERQYGNGVTLTASANKDAAIVLDPNDPSFFLRGNLLGLSKMGKIENVAIGMSTQGKIPYSPKITWGMNDKLEHFDGQLFIAGEVPFETLPLSINGNVTVDLASKNKHKGLGNGDQLRLGSNDKLVGTLPMGDALNFSIDLAEASAFANISASRQTLCFSAQPSDPVNIMPSGFSLHFMAGRIAGCVDSKLSENELKATGKIEIPVIGTIASAKLNADKSGVKISGNTHFAGERFDVVGKLDKHGIHLKGSNSINLGIAKGSVSLDVSNTKITAKFSGKACLHVPARKTCRTICPIPFVCNLVCDHIPQPDVCLDLPSASVNSHGKVCEKFPILGHKCFKVL